MSRRSKRTDPASDQAEHRRSGRRAAVPLPEVMLARRPACAPPPLLGAPLAPPLPPAASPPEPLALASKRAARIVGAPLADDSERERRHLLERLLESEGPAAITRAANAYRKAGFSFPQEQLVQLKLLEHKDDSEV